jgi:hypothetical protein
VRRQLAKALAWTLIALAAVAVAAQLAAQRVLASRIETLRLQQQPWLRLSVGQQRVWLWGAVHLCDLRLAPQDWYNAVWQLPLGYELRIARVAIDHPRWHLSGPQRGELAAFDVHLRGLHLPVPERWGWTYALGAPGSALARPPSLYDLGYRELIADAELRVYPQPRQHRLRVDGEVRVTDFADFQTQCTLQAGAEALDGDTRRLGLSDCRLTYRDRGAVARWQRALAQRAGLSRARLEDLLARSFQNWAQRAGLLLDAPSLTAFAAFVRAPHVLALQSAPPAPVPFDALRAAPPSGWFEALRLRLRPAPTAGPTF